MGRYAFVLLFLASTLAQAGGGGPLGIDHRWSYNNSGAWSRSNQNFLRYGSLLGDVGLALWEGNDSRLGSSAWRSMDALALSTAVTETDKRVFGRLRPQQSSDPSQWRKGGRSFPSGEVAEISAIVTPYVLEYGPDHPAVYALELLPAYDAVARMKVQAHWQTDVLAGFAIGTLSGYVAHKVDTTFVLSILPQGFSAGLRQTF